MLVTPITELVVEEHGKICYFIVKKMIFTVYTNDGYHKFVEDKACLVKKVSYTWHIVQCIISIARW